MRLFLCIVLILVIAVPAMGQVFQITTERDTAGKCINWQDITASVSYVESAPGVKQIFTDIPDESALDDDDLQEWYVPVDDGEWNLVSFSFTGVGMTIPNNIKFKQYWFRFSQDSILFSDSQAVVVTKPNKPVHK